MSQPTPSNPPDNPNQPPTPDTIDPEQQAADARVKSILKETLLEVIAEHEAAPPKGKSGGTDFLKLLFGPSK